LPAEQPTILATSGGFKPGSRTRLEFDRLLHHAVELSGVSGRAPRVAHIGTAASDQRAFNAELDEAARLVYHGTSLIEAVAEVRGKGAYIVTGSEDAEGADEERLEPRYLG
jgi:hypothetical protein